MKANELRLGNLYNDNGITCIVTPSIIQEVFDSERTWCKPIPLTEQWIERFGFDKVNTPYQFGWYKEVQNRVLCWCHSDIISLEFKPTQCDIYGNTLFDFKCEHVHTLQNLFYSLTGEELKLK